MPNDTKLQKRVDDAKKAADAFVCIATIAVSIEKCLCHSERSEES